MSTRPTPQVKQALQRRRNKVARLLLQQAKTDINKADHHGVCALHHVVLNDNCEGLALLLAREDLTSLNERNRWKETPIVHALACNAVDCFRLMILDPRLDLDVRDGHQRSLEEVQSLVAEQQSPTFETIEELLRDQRTKFSMLAGQGPAVQRLKEELVKYWVLEASRGRTIEKCARAWGHSQLAHLVAQERKRRAAVCTK